MLRLQDRLLAREKRLDHRAGVVAAAAVNAQGGWDKPEKRAARPDDFFRSLEPPEQTPDEQLAILQALTAELGGDDRTEA